MNPVTFLALALFVALASASTSCATDGTSATYTETLTNTNSKTRAKRTITTTGCPNHYSLCTGMSGQTGCGGVGVAGTGTQATEQSTSYSMLLYPIMQSSTTTDTSCSSGSLGIALNGVSIYGPAVSFTTCEVLDVDDSSSEWTSFDYCSGHSQSTGMYHYHFPPSCLLSALVAAVSTSSATAIQAGHSPQIGWHLDGFPIYGPYGVGGVQMIPCSSSSANSPYCTDSCGGLEYEISTLDNFKYRYYMMGNTSDMSSLPSDPKPDSSYYPYGTACRKGCLVSEYLSGTCTGTSGYTDSYSPATNAGYTTAITTSMLNQWTKEQGTFTKHISTNKVAVFAVGVVALLAGVALIAVLIRRFRPAEAIIEAELVLEEELL